jgi:hypothetical protein
VFFPENHYTVHSWGYPVQVISGIGADWLIFLDIEILSRPGQKILPSELTKSPEFQPLSWWRNQA